MCLYTLNPMANSVKRLTLARKHLQVGNLSRARAISRRVLEENPSQAEGWHLLGLALAEGGDLAQAAVAIGKALALRGPEPLLCANLGRIMLRAGHCTQAAACFRQALANDPFNPAVSLDLGRCLRRLGRLTDAVMAFEHAAELDALNPECWRELGAVLHDTGQFSRAARAYECLVRLAKADGEAQYNLGVVRLHERRNEDAIGCFRRAIELHPEYPEAHNNLGVQIQALGGFEEAEREFRLALAANAGFDVARYNLARLLQQRGDIENAAKAYREILSRSPEMFEARANLGVALVAAGQVPAAVAEYRAALKTASDAADIHANLGRALLALGQWDEGWREFEWRLHSPLRPRRDFGQPAWDGRNLHGKRILIHAEQGFGDTLQFSRFAPLVHRLGGRVLFECQPALASLLATLDGIDRIVAEPQVAAEFDCHAGVLSIPGLLRTNVGDVPADVPYLLPDREMVEQWSDRLAAVAAPELLRVGLTWAGNPGHGDDRNRSIPAAELDILRGIAGIAWFSLQKNARENPDLPLTAVADRCSDFAETAAAILNLDLVISVDTAVAHLAGAIAKPVWTLLPISADWRWLLDRSDTPWYPTMRLFRQAESGEWGPVLKQVRQELRRSWWAPEGAHQLPGINCPSFR